MACWMRCGRIFAGGAAFVLAAVPRLGAADLVLRRAVAVERHVYVSIHRPRERDARVQIRRDELKRHGAPGPCPDRCA